MTFLTSELITALFLKRINLVVSLLVETMLPNSYFFPACIGAWIIMIALFWHLTFVHGNCCLNLFRFDEHNFYYWEIKECRRNNKKENEGTRGTAVACITCGYSVYPCDALMASGDWLQFLLIPKITRVHNSLDLDLFVLYLWVAHITRPKATKIIDEHLVLQGHTHSH